MCSFILNARITHYPNISFAKPCYFLFASGNKRRLWTFTWESRNTSSIKKYLANLHFFGLRFFSTYRGIFILYLRLQYFALPSVYCVGWYVNDMSHLFSLICTLLVNHSEISTPIGAVLELRSHANLPCLVKLAHSVHVIIVQLHILANSV